VVGRRPTPLHILVVDTPAVGRARGQAHALWLTTQQLAESELHYRSLGENANDRRNFVRRLIWTLCNTEFPRPHSIAICSIRRARSLSAQRRTAVAGDRLRRSRRLSLAQLVDRARDWRGSRSRHRLHAPLSREDRARRRVPNTRLTWRRAPRARIAASAAAW